MDFWGFEGRGILPGDGFALMKELDAKVTTASGTDLGTYKIDEDEKSVDDPKKVADDVIAKITDEEKKKKLAEEGGKVTWMDAIADETDPTKTIEKTRTADIPKKTEEKKEEEPTKYEKTANDISDAVGATTKAITAVAGAVGSLGMVGLAGRYSGAAFGIGTGPIGFSYSDPSTGFSGSVGEGGSYGGGFGGIDLSNTSFSIGLQGGDARSKAHELDAIINQLLSALKQGNVDAIESAITFINLKSKTTLIGASVQVIKAMQLYDKNMKQISDRMGQIAGMKDSSSASGQLAQANAEMNSVSMTRQAITNTLRDIMTMVEEMSNLESSIYSRKDREAQFTRWA